MSKIQPNEPPVYIISGHPCFPITTKYTVITEDNDMPHGIDDDFDPSLFEFPLPSGDESRNFWGKKGGDAPKTSNVTNNFGQSDTIGGTSPIVSGGTQYQDSVHKPALAQGHKIIRTPEMVALEVATFHNALLNNLVNWYSPNGQREIMISVLTQDFLHKLLNQ